MIRILDQHTIDKIAAGEVIERPASVVKELVENSIDAGSTRITIEITDGGTSMIRVTDNGSGIEAEDVRKAYMSHATSKLDNVDDLMNIVSLGFRGEALSTIAAVSEVEMVTKTHASVTGSKYVIKGGKEEELKEVGTPDGTTIICRNLFYNTPARKKFLKTNMTEGSYINDLIVHIALSNPEVAIRLISNGKTIVDTQGDGRLKETIYSLYGKDITRGLLEADYETEDIRITGYIGKPFLSKGNRSFENYFVNKRYIKSPVVNRAIEEAYKTHIMQHKFPFTALFIDVPAYMVDVNVHPAKREFRFDNEKALFSAVFHAVEEALKTKDFIPDAGADYSFKQNTPAYTVAETPVGLRNIKKADEFNESANISTESVSDISSEMSKQPVNSSENANSAEKISANDNLINNPSNNNSINNIMNNSTNYSEINSANNNSAKNVISPKTNNKPGNSFSILESLLPKEYRERINKSIADNGTGILPKGSYRQEELTDSDYLSEAAREKHRVIGLAFDTYWITEYEDCLYLMDQHAAHEKVNYETFLKEYKERTILSQNIYPPEVISLSAREKQAVLEHTDYLKTSGFEVEDFGSNDIKINAVPANLLGLDSREVFMELASYLADEITGLTEDIFVRKLATMGCKAAVKGNQKITVQEVEELMDRLMKLDNPYTCPHGRPTIIKMSKADIDKKFKRIVD